MDKHILQQLVRRVAFTAAVTIAFASRWGHIGCFDRCLGSSPSHMATSVVASARSSDSSRLKWEVGFSCPHRFYSRHKQAMYLPLRIMLDRFHSTLCFLDYQARIRLTFLPKFY